MLAPQPPTGQYHHHPAGPRISTQFFDGFCRCFNQKLSWKKRPSSQGVSTPVPVLQVFGGNSVEGSWCYFVRLLGSVSVVKRRIGGACPCSVCIFELAGIEFSEHAPCRYGSPIAFWIWDQVVEDRKSGKIHDF